MSNISAPAIKQFFSEKKASNAHVCPQSVRF